MGNPGLQFDSGEALMNYYIKTLAPVVGSDEEAKKKIYLVSCELGALGFGVKIDWKTSLKLGGMPDVEIVLEDYYSDDRTNYPGAQSTTAFVPSNWNHRLFNIFSYYYLSEGKMEHNSDHWLININQPDDGFATREQVFDCCIETLAKVVGSEEKAKEKLYMVWCIPPFGFGAEIDEDTSIKLEGLPNVLKVLPDKAFDVKNKGAGVLAVYPSLDMNFGATFSSCCPPEVYDSDGNIGEPVGVNVLSASQFTQINRNHRLEDIFSYHIHSEWNSEWRDDHWLVVIRKPDGGFADVGKSVHFCIQILAEVVGSESKAKEKIYAVWSKIPFGFGVEINEETAEKLKALQNVLIVLPDHSFSVKNKDRGVLVISSVDFALEIRYIYMMDSPHDSELEDFDMSDMESI
ncbi:hypothetical protein IFM89_015233 [Coptis chinensis]|uniref:MORF/ORRM1/DAG-like MORF domain-containing protein n=1 Tax=Coptis chinensis TaxID=261450 RepID=A0A835LI40_9MAGN|nr:hypothetical protein IFM89_015233 [Coptis chinensis]